MRITTNNSHLAASVIHDERGLMTGFACAVDGGADDVIGASIYAIHSPMTLCCRLFFAAPRPVLMVECRDMFTKEADVVTAPLDECLPDDDEFWEAYGELVRTGRYQGGGGAASAYVLTLVD